VKRERLHHLDGLRALTMLLILPAHALAVTGLKQGWNDVEATLFWLIHVFRLPLFFLVAGFFAAHLLAGRGTAELLRNRAVRIGVPLVVCVLVVAPVLTLLLRSIAVVEYRPGAQGIAAFAHLHPSFVWFLWYLALLYPAALLARRLLLALPRARALLAGAGARLLPHPIAPLALAIPCAVLLYRQPTWTAGTPSESFLPQLDLLAYYAVFFACGWGLCSIGGLREKIEAAPGRYAALAGLALPPALALYLTQSEAAIGTSRWFHLLALLLLSVTTWSLAFGLLGLSRRFLRSPSPRLRYWADASYWIYLSHFPLMAAIAIGLFELAMPSSLRLAILVAATLALVFPAYGAFVRHGPVGRVLHGRRAPRARPEPRHGGTRLTRPRAATGRRA